MNDFTKNYENLARAIIVAACNDYEKGSMSEEAFTHFIYSDWFGVLTQADPDAIYEGMQIRKEDYEKKRRKLTQRKEYDL